MLFLIELFFFNLKPCGCLRTATYENKCRQLRGFIFFKDVYLKGVDMNVKIKLCGNEVLPTYAHIGDACCDCYAAEDLTIAQG